MKKSNLKAHCRAGPKSPKRISAKKAALPSAFYEHEGARLLHGMFTESELEQVSLRIAIGELCAAILQKQPESIVQSFSKLRELVSQKENGTLRLELCAFCAQFPDANRSTPGFERFLPAVEPAAPRKSRARPKKSAAELGDVRLAPAEDARVAPAAPAGARSRCRRAPKRQPSSAAGAECKPEADSSTPSGTDSI